MVSCSHALALTAAAVLRAIVNAAGDRGHLPDDGPRPRVESGSYPIIAKTPGRAKR